MRFKLQLELINSRENILPLNYQYELSAWIYKVLNHADPGFSAWLHDHGYTDDSKKFKLFTFSNLIVPRRKVTGDRLEISGSDVSLVISMLPDEMAGHFITGLFQGQVFRLGDKISQVSFRVVSVEGLPDPKFSGQMMFRALAPLLISFLYPGERYARYLAPDQPDYPALFIRNLKEKYRTFFKKAFPFDEREGKLEILTPPRKKGILIKAGTPYETKLIGYQYDFRLTAPSDLIRLGYYTGFGEKNSLGFGCVEVK